MNARTLLSYNFDSEFVYVLFKLLFYETQLQTIGET